MNTINSYWMGLLCVVAVGLTFTGCDETEPDNGPSRNLIYHETFEGPEPFANAYNKEVGDWDHALKYVDSIAYDGSRSVRFEVRHDDPMVAQGKRSEVTIIMGTNELLTKNAWYSFGVYFPDTYVSDTTYDVVSQWYNEGSPVRLITKRDRILIDIGSDSLSKEKIVVGDLVRDKWQEFVFHFIHSPYDDGFIEIWHNAERKVARHGGNTYNELLPKWKIGIYKAAFESGQSLVTSRVVFFDNVKIGDEKATYRDMEPRRP